MPTKIQGGLGIDKVQDGTVGLSDVDTELYGKITALTTINLGEAKTASGTVVDFDVPEGVKRVTVMFDGVSTNGTSTVQIQIGQSGVVQTAEYIGSAQIGTSAISSTTGVPLFGGTVGDLRTCAITFVNITGDTWISTGITTSNGLNGGVSMGHKTLSGTLDRIRITTVNGTDQFDAGTINISWEF